MWMKASDFSFQVCCEAFSSSFPLPEQVLSKLKQTHESNYEFCLTVIKWRQPISNISNSESLDISRIIAL